MDQATAKVTALRLQGRAKAGSAGEVFRQSDHAWEAIRRAIACCELMPGTTVSESELERRFGLKRAATRTALERLAVHGLVRPLHRRGYDLYQLREIVERAVVRLAAGRVDEVSLRRLDKVCSESYTPFDRDSEEKFLRANSEFHMLIAVATGNERLTSTVRNILNEMERIFHFGLAARNRTDEMRHEHESLIVALAKGDAAEAEKAICDELSSSKAMVLDALMSSASLLDVNITSIARQTDALGQFPA
jgi:DNA-binding GntR family transcriptional regulator